MGVVYVSAAAMCRTSPLVLRGNDGAEACKSATLALKITFRAVAMPLFSFGGQRRGGGSSTGGSGGGGGGAPVRGTLQGPHMKSALAAANARRATEASTRDSLFTKAPPAAEASRHVTWSSSVGSRPTGQAAGGDDDDDDDYDDDTSVSEMSTGSARGASPEPDSHAEVAQPVFVKAPPPRQPTAALPPPSGAAWDDDSDSSRSPSPPPPPARVEAESRPQAVSAHESAGEAHSGVAQELAASREAAAEAQQALRDARAALAASESKAAASAGESSRARAALKASEAKAAELQRVVADLQAENSRLVAQQRAAAPRGSGSAKAAAGEDLSPSERSALEARCEALAAELASVRRAAEVERSDAEAALQALEDSLREVQSDAQRRMSAAQAGETARLEAAVRATDARAGALAAQLDDALGRLSESQARLEACAAEADANTLALAAAEQLVSEERRAALEALSQLEEVRVQEQRAEAARVGELEAELQAVQLRCVRLEADLAGDAAQGDALAAANDELTARAAAAEARAEAAEAVAAAAVAAAANKLAAQRGGGNGVPASPQEVSDALSQALRRGYLPADAASGRGPAVGASAIVQELVGRLSAQRGGSYTAAQSEDLTAMRDALAGERAQSAALRQRCAALEAAAAMGARPGGGGGGSAAALAAQVASLKSQHRALRESVILLKAAVGPALGSASQLTARLTAAVGGPTAVPAGVPLTYTPGASRLLNY